MHYKIKEVDVHYNRFTFFFLKNCSEYFLFKKLTSSLGLFTPRLRFVLKEYNPDNL